MTDLDRYLTEEVVEKAARTMKDDWDPDRLFRDYAQTALTAVLPDIIRQAKEEAWDEALQARAGWMQDQRYYVEDEVPNPYRIEQGGQS